MQVEAAQNAVIRWLHGDAPPSEFSAEICQAAFISTLLNWSSTRLETSEILGAEGFVRSADDIELRKLLFALAGWQDRVDSVNVRYLSQNVHLANQFPDLVKRFDTAAGEYLESLECDAQGMRASQSFKNVLFANMGRQNAILHARKKELELLEAIAAKVNELDD